MICAICLQEVPLLEQGAELTMFDENAEFRFDVCRACAPRLRVALDYAQTQDLDSAIKAASLTRMQVLIWVKEQRAGVGAFADDAYVNGQIQVLDDLEEFLREAEAARG